MISAIIFGLIAGWLAQKLSSGPSPGGFVFTLVLGIVGSLLGFYIFTEGLGIGDSDAFDLLGLPGAVIGSMILLWLGRKLS